jgi:hypothetical protein
MLIFAINKHLKIYMQAGIRYFIKAAVLTWSICLLSSIIKADSTDYTVVPGKVTSTQQQAIEYVEKISELKPSLHWPKIKPGLFLKNLKTNIHNIVSIYPGSSTNFCGYGALTYLFLQDDPLGYATLLLQLYSDGKATFRNVSFDPSPAIKRAAGALKFKGLLDINPAEQMWFLILADHYKGYLNLFNRKFDPGDENRFWASVNYAKFNRMGRDLLNYNSKAKGADLMRPKVGSLYKYISEKMKTGSVVLFINNRIVHKKDHIKIKLGVPTHFIVAEKISIENDTITFMYWDYGRKTQLQVSTAFFKRIVFGITWFTKKETDAE